MPPLGRKNQIRRRRSEVQPARLPRPLHGGGLPRARGPAEASAVGGGSVRGAAGRLRFFAAEEVPARRRKTLTAVRKSERWDRMILDRCGPTAEEARLRRASQELTPGWTLCDVVLGQQQTLRLYSTDLCEMLYAFEVSLARGCTNCIVAEVELRVLEGTRAADEFRRRTGVTSGRARVLMSLFIEPMGEGNAIDFAQEAHGEVLRSARALAGDHRVLGRSPLPAGRVMELLTVDDHCGVALVDRSATAPPDDSACQELEQIFVRSAAKHDQVDGLEMNKGKTIRGAENV